jgi:hypothetical protein
MDKEQLVKEIVSKGHVLYLDNSGNPDAEAFEFYDIDGDGAVHEGYMCIKCGRTWCALCEYKSHHVYECSSEWL